MTTKPADKKPIIPRVRVKKDSELMMFIKSLARDHTLSRDEVADRVEAFCNERGRQPPSRYTLVKQVSKLRKPSGLQDEPLTLQGLLNSSIPSEALPSVIDCAFLLADDPGIQWLTYRDAKWIARLYLLFKGNKRLLVDQALLASNGELLGEVTGEKFSLLPEHFIDCYIKANNLKLEKASIQKIEDRFVSITRRMDARFPSYAPSERR